MKKDIMVLLFLLATSLVAAIAVGCDGTGFEDATEDASITEDTADTCPEGLVFRSSDGQCVYPEDVIDDSADEVNYDTAEDTTVADPCADWMWLDGTEWDCGATGGSRIRLDIWESDNNCFMVGYTVPKEQRIFTRNPAEVNFTTPTPEQPMSFWLEDKWNGPCVLDS